MILRARLCIDSIWSISVSVSKCIIPNRGRIFQYRSDYPCIEIEQVGVGHTRTPELFLENSL